MKSRKSAMCMYRLASTYFFRGDGWLRIGAYAVRQLRRGQ